LKIIIIMKNTFKQIGLAVGLLTVFAVSAFATITTLPIGGNDNASIQQFGVTNTVVPGTVYYATNSGNGNGAGGYIDVSEFDAATLFFVATNATANPATNKFSLYRALDNSGLTTETTAYATYTVPIAAGTYEVWQTNLIVNDIGGQGFLTLGTSLTNSSPTGTNGAGGAGYGFTNNFPTQIGVMFKIKHALR
jgi:hypothetical protein